jgi:hypothetical protein
MRSLDQLYREADSLGNIGINLACMVRDIRSDKFDGYTTSVVKMTVANYRNMLEAALATANDVEAECLLICHQREAGNPVYDLSQRLPSPRPSADLPATVSPCAAE